MMTTSPSLSSSGSSHSRLDKAISSRAIWPHWTRSVPALQMFHRGQTGSQVKDIGGRNSCVATLCSLPAGHISHDQQIPAACCPSATLVPVSIFSPPLQPPNPCTAKAGTCAQGTAQFPWVSRATDTTIKRSILGWDVIWWADLPTPP